MLIINLNGQIDDNKYFYLFVQMKWKTFDNYTLQ